MIHFARQNKFQKFPCNQIFITCIFFWHRWKRNITSLILERINNKRWWIMDALGDINGKTWPDLKLAVIFQQIDLFEKRYGYCSNGWKLWRDLRGCVYIIKRGRGNQYGIRTTDSEELRDVTLRFYRAWTTISLPSGACSLGVVSWIGAYDEGMFHPLMILLSHMSPFARFSEVLNTSKGACLK